MIAKETQPQEQITVEAAMAVLEEQFILGTCSGQCFMRVWQYKVDLFLSSYTVSMISPHIHSYLVSYPVLLHQKLTLLLRSC